MTTAVPPMPTEEIERVFLLQQGHRWVQRQTTADQRAHLLQGLAASIEKHADRLQEGLHADLRRAMDDRGEIRGCLDEIGDAIANLGDWMAETPVEPSLGEAAAGAKIVYESRGVVLLFGAWNFPLTLLFRPLAQILAAGNCAIIRTNELTPRTSAVIADVIRDAFSEEVVAVFEGGVELADQLLELPVDHIFFTGSAAVGRRVMAAAATHLATVTLELGGKNPVIVDKNADIADAAGKIAFMRNINSGQVCLCPENVFVHEESLDRFLAVAKATYEASFYVDGELNQDAQGKIVNGPNFARVKGYLDDAISKGARVAVGGGVREETLGVEPTVLVDVPGDAAILHEEVFGPILSVFTYSDVAQVYSTLHAQPKPLAMYIFSSDDAFIDDVLANTTSGGVTVNSCMMHFAEKNLPFGGVNQSGIGAYRGIHGFRELSHARSVLYMA